MKGQCKVSECIKSFVSEVLGFKSFGRISNTPSCTCEVAYVVLMFPVMNRTKWFYISFDELAYLVLMFLAISQH